MQQEAIDCANTALEKFNIEKDIAAYIKKEFDKKYNPTWHCVVGRNFGSYVTHETKHFIYFYIGQVAVLLFKSGWYLIFISSIWLTLRFNVSADSHETCNHEANFIGSTSLQESYSSGILSEEEENLDCDYLFYLNLALAPVYLSDIRCHCKTFTFTSKYSIKMTCLFLVLL